MQTLYPWLIRDWQYLLDLQRNGRLPHALLLTGQDGVGKTSLAQQLSALLLCQTPSIKGACGECSACLLLRAGTHPDLMKVSPEQSGKAIKVEQVRAVKQFIAQTAQQGGRKVVLLSPADALNISAANALLKNLEEPSGDSTFILISHQSGQILATIRSRCSRFEVARPAQKEACEWLLGRLDDPEQIALLLNLANGAPLKALAMAESGYLEQRQSLFQGLTELQAGSRPPMEVARQWQEMEPLAIVNWLIGCVDDLVKFKLTGDKDVMVNKDSSQFFSAIFQQLRLNELYLYRDRLLELKRALLSGNNPNKLLTLEKILINWLSCSSRS